MFISNRFDLGDEVYFINEENKPCKDKVQTILVHVTCKSGFDPEPRISYVLAGDDLAPFDESQLYSNEWDLKDRWLKDLIEFV